jgi:hypothetical protein
MSEIRDRKGDEICLMCSKTFDERMQMRQTVTSRSKAGDQRADPPFGCESG